MNKKIILTLALSLLIITGIIAAYLLANMTDTRTTVYVSPDKVVRSIDADFAVNISISNVANLYAWECKLGWNMTVLELVNVTEGAFLKKAGSTFFSSRLNETVGHVVIDCTLLGNSTGANGNGVLASIQFHVKNEGACDLVPYDAKFVDASDQMIAHVENRGHFSASS
jgi:hypothetical protein